MTATANAASRVSARVLVSSLAGVLFEGLLPLPLPLLLWALPAALPLPPLPLLLLLLLAVLLTSIWLVVGGCF